MGKIFAFTSAIKSNYPEIINSHSLRCPVCNNESNNLHFLEPVLINGNDSYNAKGLCGWEGRGSLIIIPFSCEQCECDNFSKFCLCIGFHKGTTAMWFFVSEDYTDSFPLTNKFSER